MKYILLIIGIFICSFLKAQDKTIDELPDEPNPDWSATEYLYLLDGSTDKSLKLSTVFSDVQEIVVGTLDTLESGSGTGTVDTLGNPASGQVMIWTDPNKIGGSAKLAATTTVLTVDYYTSFTDSAYIDYMPDGQIEWVGKTTTGALFSDSLSNAGFMLGWSNRPSISKHMSDRKGNEIAWYHLDVGHSIVKSYGLEGMAPTDAIQCLMAANEQAFIYIEELDKRLKKLEGPANNNGFLVLIVFMGMITILGASLIIKR